MKTLRHLFGCLRILVLPTIWNTAKSVIEKSEDTLNVTPELCLKIRSGTNIDPVLFAIGHLPLNCYFYTAPLILISYK